MRIQNSLHSQTHESQYASATVSAPISCGSGSFECVDACSDAGGCGAFEPVGSTLATAPFAPTVYLRRPSIVFCAPIPPRHTFVRVCALTPPPSSFCANLAAFRRFRLSLCCLTASLSCAKTQNSIAPIEPYACESFRIGSLHGSY